MAEDTETNQPNEETQQPVDDSRFEVKWRKKNEPSAAAQTQEADAAGVSSPGATTSVADLERQLEDERKRVSDLQDRWQRAAADLANLRRRTEQERGEVEQFASMLLVQELLPVLDNFERAIATIPGNLQMLTWIHGVMLIERHLRAILERQGLKSIEAQGQPFNAYYHEAISEKETAEAAPGTVLQEYQRGYTMHGRVIRPTLVEVARAPVDAGRPETAQTSDGADEALTSEAGAQAPSFDTEDRAASPDVEAEEATIFNEEVRPAGAETRGEEVLEEAERENIGP